MENSKIHNLIVDDDDRIRNLLKDFLSENNNIVSSAEHADEAKEKLLINILDTAEPAVKKAKPKRTLIVLLSLLAGFILAIPLAIIIDRRKN